MMTTSSSHPRLLCRSVIVSAIATLGVLSGIVPGLSSSSPNHSHTGIGYSIGFGSSAYAQSASNEEVRQYAKAVLLMEPIRQSAYAEIKKIIGSGDVPNIVCHERRSLQALPRNAQSIAANYCNQSKKIITSNGLSISRFNEMTMNAQSDANLKTRIQNELLRLQTAK